MLIRRLILLTAIFAVLPRACFAADGDTASFRRDVIAALSVGGCSMGGCHGGPTGKGGFKLGLRVVALNYEILYAVDLQVAEPKKGKGKLDEIPVSPDPKAKQVAGVRRLSTPDAVGDCFPSFSPDGQTIVFASRRDNDYEIYSIKLDGTGLTRLTSTPGIDSHPVFSPDGKRIAFTSNRDFNYEIYVMNADGSNPQRVTDHPERDDYPCWSKDGRELFFVGERNGKYGIYRVTAP